MQAHFRILLTAILLIAVLTFGFVAIGEDFGVPAALGIAALLVALNQPVASPKLGAASTAVDTPMRMGEFMSLPIAADTVIWAGALVARDASGYAVPASDTTGLRVIGRAERTEDNTGGAAGALNVSARLGTFKFTNSATNPVTAADVGKMAVVEADDTVAVTSTHKVSAGRILSIEADGVWINTRFAFGGPKAVIEPLTGSEPPTEGEFNALVSSLFG